MLLMDTENTERDAYEGYSVTRASETEIKNDLMENWSCEPDAILIGRFFDDDTRNVYKRCTLRRWSMKGILIGKLYLAVGIRWKWTLILRKKLRNEFEKYSTGQPWIRANWATFTGVDREIEFTESENKNSRCN